MLEYRTEDLSPDEIEHERKLHGGLADSTRELVDAVIRSSVDDEEIRAVAEQIDALTARLRARQIDGPFGVAVNSQGTVRNHGNAVVGLRNAVAPPLDIHSSEEGRAWADFTLGAAYEGPPGLVHGGVSALLLDQVAGEAAAAGGAPGMTGTLTLRYRRGTPLGPLHAEMSLDRIDGRKAFVSGFIGDADGPTVEAEGIFITPSWARELFEQPLKFE